MKKCFTSCPSLGGYWMVLKKYNEMFLSPRHLQRSVWESVLVWDYCFWNVLLDYYHLWQKITQFLEASIGTSDQIRWDQLLSRVWLFATQWIAARQASLSITNSRSSLRLTSIKSVMPSSHLIVCRPLLLLPPIPPSIRVFYNDSTLHMRWPKYWSFSFSISPSKEIPGLISFRMDWLDLLAVQGTLKSLLDRNICVFKTFGHDCC